MFTTVLIANRGEIACRAIRTLKRLGITSVAVYSDADRNAPHVTEADRAVALGGDKAADSYLRIDKILAAATATGAQAIYPGYGFLSESAEFAEACEAAGIAFIGPTAAQIREFGLKHRARELAALAGVPMTPGTGLLENVEQAVAAAARIGYPVMLKSTAGGGGIGLTRCDDEAALRDAYDSVKRLGEQFFRDAGAFIERFVDRARHVEVQIFGDGQGRVVALGERDCSLQRRNQKVVEETPAPHLPAATRQALHRAAVALGESVNYRSAGTVEFIYDAARDEFYFLEVNTRLQVEHPITEMVTGLDLIACMLQVAAGDALDWAALQRAPQGVAIEVRLYAEDPLKNFQPSPGVLTEVHFPTDVRLDGWVATGSEVSAFYDPMIAKLIVHGADRAQALEKTARGAGGDPSARHRHQPRLSAAGNRHAAISARRRLDAPAGRCAFPAALPRSAATRHLQQRAGLSRPPRLLGYRRAAVRPDGRLRVPAGQPHRRQPPGGRRARVYPAGADVALSLRRHHRADGCQLPGRFGRRSGRLLAADRGAGRAGADAGARYARLPHLSGGTQRL